MVQELPTTGVIDIVDYLDFNVPKLVKYIDKLEFCKEFKLREGVNLKEYIKKIKEPTGGLVEYKGLKKLSW